MDWLYDHVLVRPYYGLAALMKAEPMDRLYNGIVLLNQKMHHWLSQSQTGRMRWYVCCMVMGLILLLAMSLEVI